MRVTHVVPTLDPSRGGPSRSVRGLARAQSDFVESVRIVAGGQPNEYESDRDNMELLSQPLLRTPFSIPSRSLQQQLRQSIAQADVVHLHSIWNGTTTCASRICRQLGKPMILSPRGMLDQHNMRRRAILKRAYLMAERANLSSMAAFHFLDDSEREGCNWLQESQDVPYLVQPNGLDIVQLQNQLAETAEGRFLSVVPDPSAKHLVFLGRLNVIKGLDLQTRLMPALLKMGLNVHLHLVGPDDGEGAELATLAKELGVSDRVHQHGPIYGQERLRWLAEANAVLLTSHYECNSVTAAETLAVGGVLVATDTCHLRRAADAQAAIVTRRDPECLARVLARLLSDDQQVGRIRQQALEFAKQSLEWSSLARQMVEFYGHLKRNSQPCAV